MPETALPLALSSACYHVDVRNVSPWFLVSYRAEVMHVKPS